MKRNESTNGFNLPEHAPAHFLSSSKDLQSRNSMYELINLAQSNVKAKFAQIREEIEWKEYLKVHEKELLTKVNTPIKDNAPTESISTQTARKTPSSTRLGLSTGASNGKSIRTSQISNALQPSQHKGQSKPVKSSIKIANRTSLNSKMSVEFQPRIQKPLSTSQRTTSENINDKLSRNIPSVEDIQRITRILLSKELCKYHLRNLPTSGGHLMQKQFAKSKNYARPNITRGVLNKTNLVKMRSSQGQSSSMQLPFQKKRQLKRVQFLDKAINTEVESHQNSLKTNGDRRPEHIPSEDEKHQNIISQQLKNIHLELEKIQDKEYSIQRKWRSISNTATSKEAVDGSHIILDSPKFKFKTLSNNQSVNKPQPITVRNSRIRFLESIADSCMTDAVSQVTKEISKISEDCVKKLYEEEFCTTSALYG